MSEIKVKKSPRNKVPGIRGQWTDAYEDDALGYANITTYSTNEVT